MAIVHRVPRPLIIVVGWIGALLLVVTLAAPELGLGRREDFVLYRWFGLMRTQTGWPGALLMIGSVVLLEYERLKRWRLWSQEWERKCANHAWGWYLLPLFEYFRLGPKTPPFPGLRRDVIALGVIATVAQTVYLLAISLGFECDGATFYAFAKALIGLGGSFSAYRPPMYPFFLLVTGTIWPGTFIFAILAQAAMGVAIPLLVYGIMHGLGRRPALIAALLVTISATPFVGAKLILAEQTCVFWTLLALFCLARYQDCRNERFIYGFVFAGLAAMLTRWEAQFLFGFGFCAIFFLAFNQARQLRHVALGVLLTCALLATYSAARAWYMHDMRVLGSLQSGTGMQVFQRLYGMSPSNVAANQRAILGWADATSEVQVMGLAKGPATQRLKRVLVEYSREHPEAYRGRAKSMAEMRTEPDTPPQGPYWELFGRFEGNAEALVENIFNSSPNLRTAQYPFFIADVAQNALGLAGGDRLLLASALDALEAKPATILVMFADGFTLTGADLRAIRDVFRDPSNVALWKALFPIGGLFDYHYVDFNIGGCAAASLSPYMMAEHRFDAEWTGGVFSGVAVNIAALGRNVVRFISGIVLLLGWWILLLAPRRAVHLPLLATLGCLILAIGISAGGGNSKYDLMYLPLQVITSISIATEAVRRITAFVRRRAEATA